MRVIQRSLVLMLLFPALAPGTEYCIETLLMWDEPGVRFAQEWRTTIANLGRLPSRTVSQTVQLSEAYRGLIDLHLRYEALVPPSGPGRAAALIAERDRIFNVARMSAQDYAGTPTARNLEGLESQRILPLSWLDWIRNLPKDAENSILDAGCGLGAVVMQLSRRKHHIVGLDLHAPTGEETVRSPNGNQLLFQGDMAAFPASLRGRKFRLILATQTVFNYEPENTALHARILLEFDRNLQPNGVVMLGAVSREAIDAALAQARLAAPAGSFQPFRLRIESVDAQTGAIRLTAAPP